MDKKQALHKGRALGGLMILAVALLLKAVDASAAAGGVAGTIYSTNILAKVNGVPVESYNIGGRTVIVAEDLRQNSDTRLGVSYDDREKLWTIESLGGERSESASLQGEDDERNVQRGSVGTILGSIHSTDVRVLFNGKPVTAYELGGRTAVCIEDLGTLEGSPNGQYGYSAYLAESIWNEKDRVVELLTFNPNKSEIMGYNVHSYEFTCIDNVLHANYNPTNAYYSDLSHKTGNTYNYTAQFEKNYFVLKPFYLNVNGESLEVGHCVISNCRGFDETIFRLTDVEGVRALLDNAKPPTATYDEAMGRLCDSGDYEVLSQAVNEGYSVVLLRGAGTTDLYVVAVRKTGGYLRIFSYPGNGVNVSFQLDKNSVAVRVYPFGGPHGPTTMTTTFDLDEYEFSSGTR